MMVLSSSISFFLFTVIINNFVQCQQYVGDYCTLQSTGESAECAIITNCQPVLDALKQGQLPQTCGFQGTTPIVCCGSGRPSGTTTRRTTTSSNTFATRPTQRITQRPTQRPTPSPSRTPGVISRSKCVEYGRFVYSKKKPVVLLVDAPDTTKNECGFTVVELVVGGEKAKIKEFPHMALLGFEQSPGNLVWACGGTIISDRYILTAGHCLYNQELGAVQYVRVGVTNMNDRPYKQEIRVSERIPFPQYSPPAHYNDIALIKLERSINLNPFARPACLYTNDNVHTKSAIATGWGDTAFLGSGSADLLKVILEFSPRPKCSNAFLSENRKLPQGIDFNLMICAGAGEDDVKEKDTCQGDSGGPLQIYHTQSDVSCMYDIIGVTSFGKACGKGKLPGVYTKVSNYIGWIESIVWPN